MNVQILAAIAAMAVVTWACRAGGLFVAHRLPQEGRMRQALESMPGCVMVALVVPELVYGGPSAWLAGAATAVAMITLRSLPVSIAVGVGVMAVARGGGA
ncbi:MAG TPA: AzlD domain-containing protein [Burkholderiaceae bacterium]|nr:AzlD domain-containing protein [Burkholderiaceae bacterium]